MYIYSAYFKPSRVQYVTASFVYFLWFCIPLHLTESSNFKFLEPILREVHWKENRTEHVKYWQVRTRAIVKLFWQEFLCILSVELYWLFKFFYILYCLQWNSTSKLRSFSQKLFTNCLEFIQNVNYFPSVWNTIQPTQ